MRNYLDRLSCFLRTSFKIVVQILVFVVVVVFKLLNTVIRPIGHYHSYEIRDRFLQESTNSQTGNDESAKNQKLEEEFDLDTGEKSNEERLEGLKEELRQVPHIITKGVRKTIKTIEDMELVRSEHLDLNSLEDTIDSTFAPHSSAKKFVRETAKAMFVALRDTTEMRTLERCYRHQKLVRGEDGKVYGIEIIYMVRGWGDTSDTSDSDVETSNSSYCREAGPEMMIAYRILVKEMEGNPEDLSDKTELAGLKF